MPLRRKRLAMIDSTEIQRIKTHVAITDVLAGRGIMPVFRTGDELLYCSPLRTDGKPSFSVNVRANVFNDLVVKEHRGDVVRLVSLLDGVGFAVAIKTLQDFEGIPDRPSFLLSGPSSVMTAKAETIRDVKLPQNPALLRYIESRGISVGIARMYLHEVHYVHDNRYLYALGFRNDKDGYFLRNGVGCKRNIGPSSITTVTGTAPDGRTANVFEGAFDFLSALEFYGKNKPMFTTYVLNSVSNLASVVETAGRYQRINAYFDRDKAGQNAFATLKAQNLPVIDRFGLFTEQDTINDFNDFLMAAKRRYQPSRP